MEVFFGTDTLFLETIVANMSLTLVWKTASYSIIHWTAGIEINARGITLIYFCVDNNLE